MAAVMQQDIVVHSLFLIFSGAALFATVALFTRQAMIVGYILLGAALGPYGLHYLTDQALIKQMADIGIIFLLFLLGLHLHPQELVQLFRKTTLLTLVSSLIFGLMGGLTGFLLGYSPQNCWIMGAAMMFSSTIIGLKLLPTTVLHHQYVGELTISILLFQDILAIVVLLLLKSSKSGLSAVAFLKVLMWLPVLIGLAFALERWVLQVLLRRFDKVQEYIFLMAIGWCLFFAVLAETIGLSHEIGAFMAGVAIATGPISLFIAENLRPLRDFFLILFFCSLGASFNLNILPHILLPAVLLAAFMLILKPVIFKWLLTWQGESPEVGWEIGVRLGQVSEFSLLIVYLARDLKLMGKVASDLVQATTILTFMVSSYLIIFNFPNPLAVKESLRRD